MQKKFYNSLEICVTSTNKKCMCSNDGRIVLCDNARLSMFPTFNGFIMRTAEELHLGHNNITAWPNETIWNAYKNLNYVDVTHNPLCTLPVLSKRIDVDISPCKYYRTFKNFLLATTMKNFYKKYLKNVGTLTSAEPVTTIVPPTLTPEVTTSRKY